MTDKQYYCKNGDLIEVGRRYNLDEEDPYSLNNVVLGYDSEGVIAVKSTSNGGDFDVSPYGESEFLSLWQEPEEKATRDTIIFEQHRDINSQKKEIEELKAKIAELENLESNSELTDGWIIKLTLRAVDATIGVENNIKG